MEFNNLFDKYYKEYYKANKRKRLWWEILLLILMIILFVLFIAMLIYRKYFWSCLVYGLMVLLLFTYSRLNKCTKIKNNIEEQRLLDKENLLCFLRDNDLYNKNSMQWIVKKCNQKLRNEWLNSMERIFMNTIFPVIMLVLGVFLNAIASITLIIVISFIPIVLSILFYLLKHMIYDLINILPFFKLSMYRFISDYLEYILATDFKCDLIKESDYMVE